MAKAIANCTCKFCGKTFTKWTIKGNRADADSWKTWAEANFDQCPDCYREAIKEQTKAAAHADGLPDLEGTPKQISWAESIRYELWHKYTSMESDAADAYSETGEMDEFLRLKARNRAVFQGITSAVEYIDHRDETLSQFMARNLKEANNED